MSDPTALPYPARLPNGQPVGSGPTTYDDIRQDDKENRYARSYQRTPLNSSNYGSSSPAPIDFSATRGARAPTRPNPLLSGLVVLPSGLKRTHQGDEVEMEEWEAPDAMRAHWQWTTQLEASLRDAEGMMASQAGLIGIQGDLLKALREEVQALRSGAVAPEAPTTLSSKPKKERVHAAVQAAVHNTMLRMIGVEWTTNAEGKKYLPLPHPLEEGAEPRRSGDVVLCTPNFTLKGQSDEATVEFIAAVAHNAWQVEKAKEDPKSKVHLNLLVDASQFQDNATTYYTQLQITFRKNTDPAVFAKYELKNHKNLLRQRVHKKAIWCRSGAKLFDAKYSVTGSRDLILTDYMSSEGSDCDEGENREDWNSAQMEVITLEDHAAWGRRHPLWRSEWLARILYAIDELLHLQQVEKNKHKKRKIGSNKTTTFHAPPQFPAHTTWPTRGPTAMSVDPEYLERKGLTRKMAMKVDPAWALDFPDIDDGDLADDDIDALESIRCNVHSQSL